VTGLPWIEVDFPADVERARKVILPEILRAEAASSAASIQDGRQPSAGSR
jgi:hypothetical protein